MNYGRGLKFEKGWMRRRKEGDRKKERREGKIVEKSILEEGDGRRVEEMLKEDEKIDILESIE